MEGPRRVTFVKVLVPLLHSVPFNRRLQGNLHSLFDTECFFPSPWLKGRVCVNLESIQRTFMEGPLCTRPCPNRPLPVGAGQIDISTRTNGNSVSPDDTLLGVTGWPLGMVTLQTCEGKGGRGYTRCTLTPRRLEWPDFCGSCTGGECQKGPRTPKGELRRLGQAVPADRSRCPGPSPRLLTRDVAKGGRPERTGKGCLRLKCPCQREDPWKWAVGSLLLSLVQVVVCQENKQKR